MSNTQIADALLVSTCLLWAVGFTRNKPLAVSAGCFAAVAYGAMRYLHLIP